MSAAAEPAADDAFTEVGAVHRAAVDVGRIDHAAAAVAKGIQQTECVGFGNGAAEFRRAEANGGNTQRRAGNDCLFHGQTPFILSIIIHFSRGFKHFLPKSAKKVRRMPKTGIRRTAVLSAHGQPGAPG